MIYKLFAAKKSASTQIGTFCENKINPCDSNPCHGEDSVCQALYDEDNNFVCNCPKSRTGNYCEADVSPCIPNPCGTRYNCLSEKFDLSYTCECVSVLCNTGFWIVFTVICSAAAAVIVHIMRLNVEKAEKMKISEKADIKNRMKRRRKKSDRFGKK